MKTGATEKRREERVNTALPVDLDGAKGITRDVSVSGIFFETDVYYAVGSPISFAVELETPAGRMTIKCRGEIVRIERRDGKTGVAVKIIESQITPD